MLCHDKDHILKLKEIFYRYTYLKKSARFNKNLYFVQLIIYFFDLWWSLLERYVPNAHI